MKLKKRTIAYLYMKRKTRMRTFYKYFETGKILKELFNKMKEVEK